MTTTEARKAAIYARISQDREGAGVGVQRQIDECRELADRLGLDVVAVRSDNDLSAFTGKPRPGYAELLSDITSGRVGVVLAWHTDRLHRSPRELEEYITACAARGVTTQTVQAGLLDLSTPSGRMTARIIGAVARQESEHKGERVRAARRQRVVAGGFGGGPRPFGFEADGVTVKADEAAEIVKATDAILAGAGLRSVVLDLNRRKVSTSLGAEKWQARTIKDILLRPRNAGLNVYRGEIVGRGEWDPIVPNRSGGRWSRCSPIRRAGPARPSSGTSVGSAPACTCAGCAARRSCGCRRARTATRRTGVAPVTGRRADGACVAEGARPRRLRRAAQHRRLNMPDAVELLQPPPPHVDVEALNAEAMELGEHRSARQAHADGQVTLSQLTRGSIGCAHGSTRYNARWPTPCGATRLRA